MQTKVQTFRKPFNEKFCLLSPGVLLESQEHPFHWCPLIYQKKTYQFPYLRGLTETLTLGMGQVVYQAQALRVLPQERQHRLARNAGSAVKRDTSPGTVREEYLPDARRI